MWIIVFLLLAVLTASVFAESELKAAFNLRRLQMLKDAEKNSRQSRTHSVSRSDSEALDTQSFHSQNSSEQIALGTLYDSTNGDLWTDHTGWNTTSDLNDWFGVTATSSSVVTAVVLSANNLAGESFPSA
jgi:hypothetical protein